MSKDPTQEAERLLNGLWVTAGGERVIPVDPVNIASKLGIDVFEVELNPAVSAAIVKRPNSDPTILLSNADHPNRQRFSCAHELGHFVLRADDPEDFEYVDFRDPKSSTGTKEEEIFANQFAAALLMPEKELRERATRSAFPLGLAYAFRVSAEAMSFRLKNLGLQVG